MKKVKILSQEYDLDYFKDNKKSAPKHAAPRGSKPKRVTHSAQPERRATARDDRRATVRNDGRNYPRDNRAPVRNERAPQKPPKKKASIGKRIVIAVVSVLVVAAVVVTVGVVAINIDRENRKKQPFAFSQGVSISGIDISGLSYDKALEKVKENKLSVVKDFTIDIKANKYTTTLDKENFSYDFDYDTALSEAKVYSLKEQGIYEPKEGETEAVTEVSSSNPDFELTYEVKVKSIQKAVAKIAKKVDLDPVNARVSKFTPFAKKRFTYKDGKVGYALDKEDLQNQITYFFDKGENEAQLDAVVDTIQPDISLEDVKNNIVGLSTASTVSTNNANGNHNMATALAACNGSVIEPGATWSFNDCTGDSNLESNGYKAADVISNKKIEQGIGGGICQASTTIFNSALFANMAIIERHNHYWASSYAYAGEDATIDYPNLDLRLKNTTDYQMFMECKMEGTKLIVNIYGYQTPDYDEIKLVSENHDIEEGESYKTTTKRILYLNGEVVSEEVVCNSTYSLKDNHSTRPEDEGSYRTTVD